MKEKVELRCGVRCERFHSNGTVGPTHVTLRTDALFLIHASTTEIQRHVACPLLVSVTLYEESDMMRIQVRGEHDIVLVGPTIPLKVGDKEKGEDQPKPKRKDTSSSIGGDSNTTSKEFKQSASTVEDKSGKLESRTSAIDFLLNKKDEPATEVDTSAGEKTLRVLYDAIMEVGTEIDHVVVGKIETDGFITHNDANMTKSVEFLPIREKVELRKKGMKRVVPTDVINLAAWDFLVAKPPPVLDEEALPTHLRTQLKDKSICMGGQIIQYERLCGAKSPGAGELETAKKRYLALSSTKVFLCDSDSIVSWFFVASLHSIVLYTQVWPPRRMELRLISGTESTAIDFMLSDADLRKGEKNATVNITVVADFIIKIAARHGVSVRSIHQRGPGSGSSASSPMLSPRSSGRVLGRRSASRSFIKKSDGSEVPSTPRNKFEEDSFFTAMPQVKTVSMRNRAKSFTANSKHDTTNGIDSPSLASKERAVSPATGMVKGDELGSRSPGSLITPQHSRTQSLQPGGGGLDNMSFAGGGGDGALIREETVATFDSPGTLAQFGTMSPNEFSSFGFKGSEMTSPRFEAGDELSASPSMQKKNDVKLRPVFQIKDYLNPKPEHSNSLSSLVKTQPIVLVRPCRRFTSRGKWVNRMIVLVEGVMYVTERIGTMRRRLFWRDITWVHVLCRAPVTTLCIFVGNNEANLVLRSIEGDLTPMLDIASVLQNSPLVDIGVSESPPPGDTITIPWINAKSPQALMTQRKMPEQQPPPRSDSPPTKQDGTATPPKAKAPAATATPPPSRARSPTRNMQTIPPLKTVERYGKVPPKKHLKMLNLTETAPHTQSIVYATDVCRFSSRGKWIKRLFVVWKQADGTHRIFIVDDNGKVHRTVPCHDVVRLNIYEEAGMCTFFVLNENCFIVRPEPKGNFQVMELASVLKYGCNAGDVDIQFDAERPLDPSEVTMMHRSQSLLRITSSQTLSPINAASPNNRSVHFKVDGEGNDAVEAHDTAHEEPAEEADDQPPAAAAEATGADKAPNLAVKAKWQGAVKQISQSRQHQDQQSPSNTSLVASPISTVSPSKSPGRGASLDGLSPRQLQLDEASPPRAAKKKYPRIVTAKVAEYNHDEFLAEDTELMEEANDDQQGIIAAKAAFLQQEIDRRWSVVREQVRLFKPSLKVFRKIIERLQVVDEERKVRWSLETTADLEMEMMRGAFDKRLSELYANLTERLAMALKEHETEEGAARDAIILTETTLRDRIASRKEDIKAFQQAIEERETFDKSTPLGLLQHQEAHQRNKIMDARKVLWQRTEAQYSEQLAAVLDRRAQTRRHVVKKTDMELTFEDIIKDETESRQVVEEAESTVRKFALKTFRQDTLLSASAAWLSEFYRAQTNGLKAAEEFCKAGKKQLHLELHLLVVAQRCKKLSDKETAARAVIDELESDHFANMTELSYSTLRVSQESTFPSWLVPQLQRVVGEVRASSSAPNSPRVVAMTNGEEVSPMAQPPTTATDPILSDAVGQQLLSVIRSLESRVDALAQTQQQATATPTVVVAEKEHHQQQQQQEPSKASIGILRSLQRKMERREADGRSVLTQQAEFVLYALHQTAKLDHDEVSEWQETTAVVAAAQRAILQTRRPRRGASVDSSRSTSQFVEQLAPVLQGETLAREMLADAINTALSGLHEHWSMVHDSLLERIHVERVKKEFTLVAGDELLTKEDTVRKEIVGEWETLRSEIKRTEAKERKKARRLGLVRRAEEELRRETSLMHFTDVIDHFDPIPKSPLVTSPSPNSFYNSSTPNRLSRQASTSMTSPSLYRQHSSYHNLMPSPQPSSYILGGSHQQPHHQQSDSPMSHSSFDQSAINPVHLLQDDTSTMTAQQARSKIRIKLSDATSLVLTALDAKAVFHNFKAYPTPIPGEERRPEDAAPTATCVFVSYRGGATVPSTAVELCLQEHRDWFEATATFKSRLGEWESLSLSDVVTRLHDLRGKE